LPLLQRVKSASVDVVTLNIAFGASASLKRATVMACSFRQWLSLSGRLLHRQQRLPKPSDHVGIALDYVFDSAELDAYIAAAPDAFPPELYPAGAQMLASWRIPDIARELHDRGYGKETVQKVLGGNHFRIAQQIWH
jgi:hypothetical protein